MPLLRCTAGIPGDLFIPKEEGGCRHINTIIRLAGWVDIDATESKKDSGNFRVSSNSVCDTGLAILVFCEDCETDMGIELSKDDINQLVSVALITAKETDGWDKIVEQENTITLIPPSGLHDVMGGPLKI